MKIYINHRVNGTVLYSCDLPEELANEPRSKQLGFAVKQAVSRWGSLRGANLRGSDLSFSYLRGANLSGSDLSFSYLRGANLSDSDLCDSDLRDSDLRYSYLCDSDLRDSDLRGADLFGAKLFGAKLNGAKGIDAPVIPNIDQAILDAVQSEGCKLDMNEWHSCETTHCRAGWAVHLAGEEGYALEDRVGSVIAGSLIYHASAGYIPNFYASNEDAMADMRKRAEMAKGDKA